VWKTSAKAQQVELEGRSPDLKKQERRDVGERQWSAVLRAVYALRICYHLLFSEVAMPQFVIEREIPGAGNLSDAELQDIARKSVGVLKEMGPSIKWLHSYVTGDKVYCVYLAPDEETVREHARRGGFPANRVSAVRRLIDPDLAQS
jgi:uncharacterized protein DUF4242